MEKVHELGSINGVASVDKVYTQIIVLKISGLCLRVHLLNTFSY